MYTLDRIIKKENKKYQFSFSLNERKIRVNVEGKIARGWSLYLHKKIHRNPETLTICFPWGKQKKMFWDQNVKTDLDFTQYLHK